MLNDCKFFAFSPVYNRDFDPAEWLGKIERDGDGKIISAKATNMLYFIQYNFTVKDGIPILIFLIAIGSLHYNIMAVEFRTA